MYTVKEQHCFRLTAVNNEPQKMCIRNFVQNLKILHEAIIYNNYKQGYHVFIALQVMSDKCGLIKCEKCVLEVVIHRNVLLYSAPIIMNL